MSSCHRTFQFFGRVLATVVFAALALPSLAGEAHESAVQVVRPGQSIQAAIDHAAPGSVVLVLPGVYRETGDATNGLNIGKGIKLIGLSTAGQRVVLENAADQRNGIVVVPSERTQCMSCHANMAPPFPLLEGVAAGTTSRPPMIKNFFISGITIRGFRNNGLFLENVDGFAIVDVWSVDNQNYGIFPTLSRNGVIHSSRSTGSGDSGVWVETSENIRVTNTLVENNLVGIEVSNSDDVFIAFNESRYNSIGVASLLLLNRFKERPGAKRITIERNSVHDNNRVNGNSPSSFLGALPSGVGILHLGVDDSLITRNRIERNGLAGIAVVDVCLASAGTPRDCSRDPLVTPEFIADQAATGNRIVGNILVSNGTTPVTPPFAFAASDLALLSFSSSNCYARNAFKTSFSILGSLPPCP